MMNAKKQTIVKVQIITIGDELLIGQVLDTNSSWMGQVLTEKGFDVIEKQSIADSPEKIEQALSRALEQADVVLLTGGLGPTKDDMTLHTLARFFHAKLVFNQEVYKNVERIILPRVGSINESNRLQAMVPDNALVFVNSMGTAPITWFEHEGKVVVSMPGVPYEMKTAMEKDVVPNLCDHFDVTNQLQYKTIAVSGITEAELSELLSKFENDLPDSLHLAYLPSMGVIKLRLSGRNAGELHGQFLNRLKDELAEYLVSIDEVLPERILGQLLRDKKLSIATAESCTGGLIAQKLTSVAGSSAYFYGAVIAYQNDIKRTILDVSEANLKNHGAVSEQVVIEMAKGVCDLLHTHIGIATSGIAGPDGGTKEKPVGTVWVAWCVNGFCTTKKFYFPYDRQINIERSANAALMGLVRQLK